MGEYSKPPSSYLELRSAAYAEELILYTPTQFRVTQKIMSLYGYVIWIQSGFKFGNVYVIQSAREVSSIQVQ